MKTEREKRLERALQPFVDAFQQKAQNPHYAQARRDWNERMPGHWPITLEVKMYDGRNAREALADEDVDDERCPECGGRGETDATGTGCICKNTPPQQRDALESLEEQARRFEDLAREERTQEAAEALRWAAKQVRIEARALTNPAVPTVPEAPGRVVGSFSRLGDNLGERRIGVIVKLDDSKSGPHKHCEWINACTLAQHSEPGRIPEGWKLVPVEPTEAMLWAEQCISSSDPEDIYHAMLAAAPEPDNGKSDE